MRPVDRPQSLFLHLIGLLTQDVQKGFTLEVGPKKFTLEAAQKAAELLSKRGVNMGTNDTRYVVYTALATAVELGALSNGGTNYRAEPECQKIIFSTVRTKLLRDEMDLVAHHVPEILPIFRTIAVN